MASQIRFDDANEVAHGPVHDGQHRNKTFAQNKKDAVAKTHHDGSARGAARYGKLKRIGLYLNQFMFDGVHEFTAKTGLPLVIPNHCGLQVGYCRRPQQQRIHCDCNSCTLTAAQGMPSSGCAR